MIRSRAILRGGSLALAMSNALGFDLHRQARRANAGEQHAFKRCHSDTSTSKRSLTSEPVALLALVAVPMKASGVASPIRYRFRAR